MNKINKSSTVLILSLLLFLFSSANLYAQGKKKTFPDTTGQKITEIKIGDQGITIKTQEGKEIKEKPGEVVVGKEGIKITTTEPKETTTTEIKIKLGGKTATAVELNEGDVVKFGRDVTVEKGDTVSRDVVCIGGDVYVKGTVEGNVVSVGGDVFVSSTGVIEKDATSIGGDVKKEPGAIVRGQTQGLDFLPGRFFVFHPGAFWSRGIGFLFTILMILFLFFLSIISLALVPRNIQKIKDEISRNAWKSALIGFLGEILILPVFILLLITIIGIPVAILILPLFILIAMILGYTSVSLIVGEKLKQNTNLKPQTQMLTLALGILAVEFMSLFANFLRIFCGIFSPLCVIFAILGFMITYVVFTIGFGGAILTLLGTRPKDKAAPITPTPEPVNPQV
ncbi:MAG: hypothetical protein MUP17_03605 [candidate division Zixibacteria bacterium]|nr:hypothetical protein [candidate division Zixibacteria bacterium]